MADAAFLVADRGSQKKGGGGARGFGRIAPKIVLVNISQFWGLFKVFGSLCPPPLDLRMFLCCFLYRASNQSTCDPKLQHG